MFGYVVEDGVGDRPASGVEDLMRTVGQSLGQRFRESFCGVVDAVICAQGLDHMATFLGTSGDANHFHSGQLTQLYGIATDRARSRSDHHGLARHAPTEKVERRVCRQAR